ncbi:hypothetical protein BN130_3688 [Cronobacter malonaticus 507]|nr:hypothetical protein BN130_3688 [Cronobacter malonaticus 507]
MHFRKRLHGGWRDVVKTHNQEAHGGFDNVRKLAFLFQTGVFELIRRGARLQPAHVAAVAGSDDINRFLFSKRCEIRALFELRENGFGFIFSFGLDQAVAVALRLAEFILVFVVVRLNFLFAGVLSEGCGVKLDVAYAELLRRQEVIGVLLVVVFDFLFGNLLLLGQRIDRDGRGANLALLGKKRSELIAFTRQNEVAADHGYRRSCPCW